MAFHLISSPELPLILGHPWLTRHNPHINWSSGEVLSWGSLCQDTCLKSPRIIPEDLKSIDLFPVPSEYHHLQSVFCKERATVEVKPLLILGSLGVGPHLQSTEYCTFVKFRGPGSILGTGRAMVLRNAPGFLPGTSWILS